MRGGRVKSGKTNTIKQEKLPNMDTTGAQWNKPTSSGLTVDVVVFFHWTKNDSPV